MGAPTHNGWTLMELQAEVEELQARLVTAYRFMVLASIAAVVLTVTLVGVSLHQGWVLVGVFLLVFLAVQAVVLARGVRQLRRFRTMEGWRG